MKRNVVFKNVILTVLISVLFPGCQKDDNPQSSTGNIKGFVQKGPFINGSSVSVYDLQSDLSPTGKTFNTQITDNKGTFELYDIPLSSYNISIRADGFYFNEIIGEQSVSQLTLYALSDISDKSNINVNVLTHLEKSRVEYLLKSGKTFTDSKAQAQKEILAIFNIEKSEILNSESLNISESGEDNGILLAITSILQGYRSESELTELLSNINNDLKPDGILDSIKYGSVLINHAIFLDTSAIKRNLTERYSQIGSTSSIPDFGKYIANFISETNFPITESIIDYPETGTNGDNILYLSQTEYISGMENWCSLAAEVPNNMALKIKITSLSRTYWFYSVGTSINWSISDFNFNTYTQTFTAIESDAICDLKMYFESGSFLIEYFEMNSGSPTRSKTIIMN